MDDFLENVWGTPDERLVRAERFDEQRRASVAAADSENLDPLRVEMFNVLLYQQARHRTALRWLAGGCWALAETGPIGWCGDRFDDLELWSRRIRARRNLGRKVVRGGT